MTFYQYNIETDKSQSIQYFYYSCQATQIGEANTHTHMQGYSTNLLDKSNLKLDTLLYIMDFRFLTL